MAPLKPDVRLRVRLDAICSRNRYTRDPQPVIDELLAEAGDHHDILTEAVGVWVGFHEDEHTRVLAAALRDQHLPGVEPWIELGRERRNQPTHGSHRITPGVSIHR